MLKLITMQHLNDKSGKPTGVYIPIEEWNTMKIIYSIHDENENSNLEIPQWHIEVVRQRMEDIKNNPEQLMDFDEAIADIEKDL